MMFINRDHERTEHDDFVLNIQPKIMNSNNVATPIFYGGIVVGWLIQMKFE